MKEVAKTASLNYDYDYPFQKIDLQEMGTSTTWEESTAGSLLQTATNLNTRVLCQPCKTKPCKKWRNVRPCRPCTVSAGGAVSGGDKFLEFVEFQQEI